MDSLRQLQYHALTCQASDVPAYQERAPGHPLPPHPPKLCIWSYPRPGIHRNKTAIKITNNRTKVLVHKLWFQNLNMKRSRIPGQYTFQMAIKVQMTSLGIISGIHILWVQKLFAMPQQSLPGRLNLNTHMHKQWIQCQSSTLSMRTRCKFIS